MVILIAVYIRVAKNSQIFLNNSSTFNKHLCQRAIFPHAIQSNKINLCLEQTNILFDDFHFL